MNISFLVKLFFKTFISLKHLSDYRTVGLQLRPHFEEVNAKKKKMVYGIQILSKQKKQHMVQRVLYISHDFPLHIVGVFFQSPAWYSVFSVAEPAIQWEPTICGGLSWKSVAENTTALHGLVHSTRIFCAIVLKNKYYMI